MSAVHVTLIEGPLPTGRVGDLPTTGAGAVLCFEGVVRPEEDGRILRGLDYEAYPGMTERLLHELAEAMIDEHGVEAVYVEHSTGHVPVGAVSFRLRIASRHRQEGIAALEVFIDRMKRDIPLWKVPVFADDT